MVVRRNRKTAKFRGSQTHGFGSKKKHRGAGNRGGRGNAGLGKHGCQRKDLREWPKAKGFASLWARKISAINVGDLQRVLPTLVAAGKVTHQNDVYTVDTQSGIDKLLGAGTLTAKLQIRGIEVSAKAKEKITAAGGSSE